MIDRFLGNSCIQGASFIYPPPSPYCQNPVMEGRTPWNYPVPNTEIKREPEEERNDSGITSESEFHSSSPGSDNSQEAPSPSAAYYSTSLTPPYSAMSFNHNPLTPPNSEPLVSPKGEDRDMDTTLTPYASPSHNNNNNNNNPPEDGANHLQQLEKMTISELCTSQTNSNDNSMVVEEKTDGGEADDEGIRVPKINSHGKVRRIKCKHCEFTAIVKVDFWEHVKIHIPKEKRLKCPHCPFITDLKHHLEYHLRNHLGSKPYKCDKCSYICVNRSMLNSHAKSHSSVYQYRCADCNYATKYMHSLKLHLRKYTHNPAMVLNPDGTPNPLPIIDVYGTRRGPKLKQQQQQQPPIPPPEVVEPVPQLMGPTPLLPYPFIPAMNVEILRNIHMIMEHQKAILTNAQNMPNVQPEPELPPMETEQNVLDLSKAGGCDNREQQPKVNKRRKGPAYKLQLRPQEQSEDEEQQDDCSRNDGTTTMFSNVEVVQNCEETKDDDNVVVGNGNHNSCENNANNTCHYCDISFGDTLLYTLHMGYHGFKDPFACNRCGVECGDKVTFFLHIARTPHS